MKFYQHWLGDYQGATKRLSMLEHGAYRLLIDEYYSSEAPLPLDLMQLHRICMAFASEEQAAVHEILNQFFEKTEEGWIHARIEKELVRSRQVSEKMRENAKKRWEKKTIADAIASKNNAEAYADTMQNGCLPQPQPQPQLKTKEVTPLSAKPDEDHRKYDSIPYADLLGAYHKFCPSLPKVREMTDKRRKALKAGWKKYEKHEGGFPAVLDTLFKKAEQSDFLTGRNDGWGGAGFDWLLKEANMVKVIEGNYDNKERPDNHHGHEKLNFIPSKGEDLPEWMTNLRTKRL